MRASGVCGRTGAGAPVSGHKVQAQPPAREGAGVGGVEGGTSLSTWALVVGTIYSHAYHARFPFLLCLVSVVAVACTQIGKGYGAEGAYGLALRLPL